MEVRWVGQGPQGFAEATAEILSKGVAMLGEQVKAGLVEQRLGPRDNNPLRLVCVKKTGNPDFRLPTFHVVGTDASLGPLIEPDALVAFLGRVPDPAGRWAQGLAYLRALLQVEPPHVSDPTSPGDGLEPWADIDGAAAAPERFHERPQSVLWYGDALRLPQSEWGHVFVIDPPYARAGAAHTGRKSQAGKTEDALGADQFWFYWFKDVARLLCQQTRRCGFVFCDYRTIHLVERAFSSAKMGWVVSQALVWDREAMGMGNPFRAGYEMIAFVRSPSFVWEGPRDIRNVLRYPWPYGRHDHHGAEKPVPLLRQLIEWISAPGERVLDLFAGSGSTLVAAEETGRFGVGVELEKHHCQTAVRRLEAVTPGQARSPQQARRTDSNQMGLFEP